MPTHRRPAPHAMCMRAPDVRPPHRFRPDRYAPESRGGAAPPHELAHVVQQSATQATHAHDSFGTIYGDAHGRSATADDKVLSVPTGASTALLQRDVDDGSSPAEEKDFALTMRDGGATDDAAADAVPAQQAPAAPAVPTLS